MSGNLVLVNGRILTMDPDRPEVTAVAILGGRIAAIGSDADVRAAVGSRVETIDLRGRTATPGLNDAHAHPMSVGHALSDLNLATPPNASIRDIIERVAAETRRRTPGAWIIGRGYDQARLAEQRHPTRHDLDPYS
ncbi:MAG: amidohydrolase, partial [Chloroflexota bacterium]